MNVVALEENVALEEEEGSASTEQCSIENVAALEENVALEGEEGSAAMDEPCNIENVAAFPGYRGPFDVMSAGADGDVTQYMELVSFESMEALEKGHAARYHARCKQPHSQEHFLNVVEISELPSSRGKRKRTMTSAAAAYIVQSEGKGLKSMTSGAFLRTGQSVDDFVSSGSSYSIFGASGRSGMLSMVQKAPAIVPYMRVAVRLGSIIRFGTIIREEKSTSPPMWVTKFEVEGEEKALALHLPQRRSGPGRLSCTGQWCMMSCDEPLPGSKAPEVPKTARATNPAATGSSGMAVGFCRTRPFSTQSG
jgi:hypothetical protein